MKNNKEETSFENSLKTLTCLYCEYYYLDEIIENELDKTLDYYTQLIIEQIPINEYKNVMVCGFNGVSKYTLLNITNYTGLWQGVKFRSSSLVI